ncbi:MAG: Transglycosylase-associated protein [Microgenomates group bacterium GW2011_GWA1_Microgenomates_45_10]|nr:MAG: Transglycosylase-associated protein [Microgenomates group bacterium GW2011_GWA1_Microgenomates_45_10]
MNILVWIVFGGLVGWVASLVMKTDAQQGILMNVIVGMVGAFMGGWLMNTVGGGGVGGFNLYSFLVALLGACVFIAILKMVRR